MGLPPIVHTDIPSTPTDRVDGGGRKWEYFPHDDRILVEQLPVDETSQGGIIISTGKDKAFMGTVVRVGPGKRTEDGRDRLPMTVAVGDIVVFGKYAGMETQLNDEKLMVMKEDDIIAIAIEVTDLPDPL
jgi:chaperonin GroES